MLVIDAYIALIFDSHVLFNDVHELLKSFMFIVTSVFMSLMAFYNDTSNVSFAWFINSFVVFATIWFTKSV